MQIETQKERAFLFGPIYPHSPIRDESILDELGRLVDAAGGFVVGRLTQYVRSPNPATFFGRGKIDELKQFVHDNMADIAVFDEELSPAQARNIEKVLKIRVIDRSELILDIFANRARTHQAKLQVELAQLKYKLPRLKRMWTHLDRIHSAIGARGPGETQIETDRRLIRVKIQQYTKKLAEMTSAQKRTIQSRKDFKVSLVGYTNAGKSTLMRALTGTDTYIADQLFATLDTLTRKLTIKGIGTCLLSDTVGFVDKLPHHLVSSFHATLSEAKEADLLLHVVDSSDPLLIEHIQTVDKVLKEMDCEDIPQFLVANKIDQDGAQLGIHDLLKDYPDLIRVSAIKGDGIDELIHQIGIDMSQNWKTIDVTIPFTHGSLLSKIKTSTNILQEKIDETGISFQLETSPHLIQQLQLENFKIPHV